MLVDCVLDLFLLLLDLWLDLDVVSVYLESLSLLFLVLSRLVVVVVAIDGLVLDVEVPLYPDSALEFPDSGTDVDSGTVERMPDVPIGAAVEITLPFDNGVDSGAVVGMIRFWEDNPDLPFVIGLGCL